MKQFRRVMLFLLDSVGVGALPDAEKYGDAGTATIQHTLEGNPGLTLPNLERLGLEQDAICTVRDVLEKVVTDYAILPAKPNMDEVKRALTLLENHAIIQRMDGKFNQSSCKFAILPTVLAAVSGEKLNAVVSALGKEDADEEAEEDPAD